MKYSRKKIEDCADWVEKNGLIEYGGAMLKDFCKEMDIREETYFQWMKKTEFAEAIKEAKAKFKARLKERLVISLSKSASGYEWEETVTEKRPGANGKMMVRMERKTNKHVPANIGAAIFLLTNIDPDNWKNKQSVDGNISVNAFEQLMKTLDREEEEDGEFSESVEES